MRSVPLKKLYYYLEVLLLRREEGLKEEPLCLGYTRWAVHVSTKFKSCMNQNDFPILPSFVLSR